MDVRNQLRSYIFVATARELTIDYWTIGRLKTIGSPGVFSHKLKRLKDGF
jgi:hypothetical protein